MKYEDTLKIQAFKPIEQINFSKTVPTKQLEFLNRVRNEYASEFLHDARIFTIEETLEWFCDKRSYDENYGPTGYWFIYDGETIIGYFRISEYSEEHKRIMIGADIAPEFTGKGYATPAYTLMMKYLFTNYNLHKISLEVLSTNLRAINLYMKLGFKVDGTKRDDIYRDGKWIDSIVMSILEKEFSK